MSASNRLIVAILLVGALAVAFWMALLGPKREQADALGAQVENLQVSLSEAEARVEAAEYARERFPADYRQLVVLGQAVPAGDESASLLVELDAVSAGSEIEFETIKLSGNGETSEPVAAPAAGAAPTSSSSDGGSVPAAATVPPTEATAALLPLGASIGPAGLGVTPYTLSFSGRFFEVADFIDGIDSLVHTGVETVAVDGRLITLDGFALSADPVLGFPYLTANFNVTTYVVPPGEGIAAGATPAAPAPSTATPASGSASGSESTEVSSR